MTEKKKVVLAYSGGLDTTCILFWLKEQGYDVVCYTSDIGQKEDFEYVKNQALKLGAIKAVVDNRQKEFVEDFIYPSLANGGIYQGRYLMGTSLARPSIAKGIIEVAKQENAHFIAHGATGKGNDQVRFELAIASLEPSLQCIAPWRLPEFYNRFKGRTDLMNYAKEKGFVVSSTADKPYSIDENIMHISIESGILEDPYAEPPESTYILTSHPSKWPEKADEISIEFIEGKPVKVAHLNTGETITGSVEIVNYLNQLGGKHGVGRIDIVEDRFIGMKSRGVYETPGATVIYNAVRDLEVCCLDKEVNKIRSQLAVAFAEKVYNGLWFSPEGEYIRQCLHLSSKQINGIVKLRIYKGNTIMIGRKADKSLYDQVLVSMDELGRFTPLHAGGFIETNAVRLRTFREVHPVNPFNTKPWGCPI